jgi:hypothetical protein
MVGSMEVGKGKLIIPGRACAPALAYDKVSGPGERHRVSIARGREVDIATGLVVLVVVLSAGKVLGLKLEVREVEVCGGSRQHSCSGRKGQRELAELNHGASACACVCMCVPVYVGVGRIFVEVARTLHVLRRPGICMHFRFRGPGLNEVNMIRFSI